jgi:hypothetical protein
LNAVLLYRWIDGNVCRRSAGRLTPSRKLRDFYERNHLSAGYHQQYLAKNPDGYCPNHSCGIPYKSAVFYSGENA